MWAEYEADHPLSSTCKASGELRLTPAPPIFRPGIVCLCKDDSAFTFITFATVCSQLQDQTLLYIHKTLSPGIRENYENTWFGQQVSGSRFETGTGPFSTNLILLFYLFSVKINSRET
jgi:hypothetical protein